MPVPRKRVRDEDIIVISSDEDEAPQTLRARKKRRRREAPRNAREADQRLPQALSPAPLLPPLGHDDDVLPHDGAFIVIDDEGYAAVDALPGSPQTPRAGNPLQHADADTSSVEPVLVRLQPVKDPVDDCLDACIELFPGISHDHVRQLFVEHQGDIQQVTNAILESSNNYPKQKDEQLDPTIAAPVLEDFIRPDRPPLPRLSARAIVEVFRSEFPETPSTYIKSIVKNKQHLYPAYLALEEAQRQATRPYPRRRARETVDVSGIISTLEEEAASAVRAELLAARAACEKAASERANFETCKREGTLQECSVCFDECPYNRAIACDSAHFTCYDCTKTYIGTEVGQGTCDVTCPYSIDGRPCGAAFSETALQALDDPKLLKKFFDLKQQQEIREADLGDLAECPFCDYKEIYPDVEDNFEFQCQNPECMVLSCRRCSRKSHVPTTCQENSKDDLIAKRHKIEEAMTAALVRTCNKCKSKFVKEFGCNKMTCNCRNTQCYVCGKTVGYEHFDQSPANPGVPKDPNKCPLYDDLEKRHKEEVEKAEQEARETVLQEFPDIAAEDLEIKMAEAVRNKPSGSDRAPRHRAPRDRIRPLPEDLLDPLRLPGAQELLALGQFDGAPAPAIRDRPPLLQNRHFVDRQEWFGLDGANERPRPFNGLPEPFARHAGHAGHAYNFAVPEAEAARLHQAFERPAPPQFVQHPVVRDNIAQAEELNRRYQEARERMLRRDRLQAAVQRRMADRADRAAPNADAPQWEAFITEARQGIAQLRARIEARAPEARQEIAQVRVRLEAMAPRRLEVNVDNLARAMQEVPRVEVLIPPLPPIGLQGARPRQR